MKKSFTYYYLLFFMMVGLHHIPAFGQTADVVHVEDNMLIVTIDKRNEEEYKNLLLYFGLQEDSLFEFGIIGQIAKDGWQLISLNKKTAVIGKMLSADDKKMDWGGQPIFFDEHVAMSGTPGYPAPAVYGENNFKSAPSVYQNTNNETVFFLRKNTNASTVYLSGNFNNWSTTEAPMQKTDSGWVLVMPLKPGNYEYKFIVDGNWSYDENNTLKTPDGYDSYNSIYFCYNYTFHLQGYPEAKKVLLSGSFNNWDGHELKMHKIIGGWEISMYLNEGTHAYKFIVDGNWIPDPDNKSTHSDGLGNFNSYVSLGDPVIFNLNGFTNAGQVILTGSFNNWNIAELKMEKTNTGWQLPYVLGAGNYEYKFIVDGIWMTDPQNPLLRGDPEHLNSLIVIKPNYTFTLKKFPEAGEVFLSGNFNNWEEPGYKMIKKDSIWTLTLYLTAGKYMYKYVVDGNWVLDPDNPLMEENEYGTGNSVLWIEAEKEYSGK